ncbi:MAG: FixH family protein [Thiohalomonadaceae bacterium]
MSESIDVLQNGVSQSSKRALRNPWVLGWLALVAVVLGVNIFMISMAFVTNPGLVSKDYYEKGRSYERTVQQRIATRTALGWELALETPERIVMQRPAAFRLHVADKVGLPLAKADVTVHAYRPSDANADFATPLAEASAGQYVGDLQFPLKGKWDLIVEVKQGEHSYQIARNVFVDAN